MSNASDKFRTPVVRLAAKHVIHCTTGANTYYLSSSVVSICIAYEPRRAV